MAKEPFFGSIPESTGKPMVEIRAPRRGRKAPSTLNATEPSSKRVAAPPHGWAAETAREVWAQRMPGANGGIVRLPDDIAEWDAGDRAEFMGELRRLRARWRQNMERSAERAGRARR